jgi:uncharacterized protein (DUF885 family)
MDDSRAGQPEDAGRNEISGQPEGAGRSEALDPSVSQVGRRFRTVAERVLDAMLHATPETATELGDHRFDDRLTDWSGDGVVSRVAMLSDALAAMDDVDDGALPTTERVDLEILRTAAARDVWLLTELREHERNPLVHLPGEALYPLLAREVGEPASRLRALAARMAAVPRRLEVAREVLHDMSRVHVETAVVQTRGMVGMLGGEVDDLLAREPALHDEVAPRRAAAVDALTEHLRWLEAQLPVSDGDPRLGEQPFAAKLWYTLDTETTPDSLLTRAESDLQAVEEAIAELACEIDGAPPRSGQVREVLDRLAGQAPVTDATILALCEQALAATTARVRELDLVSVPDDPVRIIVMPSARRGVAVGYCDPPGPLEPPGPDGLPLPTLFAVSPTPEDWSTERVTSFYREYNGHMLRNLTAHEVMPGHWLQLAHAARFSGSTRVRAANWSGPFIEGWAVYAEEQVASAGLGLGEELDAALRMQQLKMQLRSTINAILDVRVHARGMTEDEAMRLMTVRGHQEEGEAAGKWRRALLTSTQLSTYYVGYHEVRDIVQRLDAARPGALQRHLHDEVLSHGSPPPRHLRTLLGLV